MNLNSNTDLIPRTTLTEMCNAWRQAGEQIRSAYAQLSAVEVSLKLAFKTDGYYFSLNRDRRGYGYDPESAEAILKDMKKDVWRCMIDRMDLRRVLSIKRAEELDKQLESGEGLPEIDEVSILAMIENNFNMTGTYIEESIRECYDWLIPRVGGWFSEKYKTNKLDRVGKRVIITWAVEGQWSGGGFRPVYGKEKNFTALDNVFHALDGKGTVKSHAGPLVDALRNCGPDGLIETDYFKGRCHRNRNLHLEFKRLDLLDKFNLVAGGMRLSNIAPK